MSSPAPDYRLEPGTRDRVELGLGVLFGSRDLGVFASVADRVLVLDQGHVCKQGPVAQVLAEQQEEYTRRYTRRLLQAAPRLPQAH